jgi:glycosyltransferase involved in cell wall biosynthesis
VTPAPQVSAVVPTQNRSAMLEQALRSALEQEDVELEVIVVDDGSADETPAVLARIDDPRLTVIRHERPLGVSRARNAGISRARGEWIAFLDDDDLWAPGKLRTQLSDAAEHGVTFSYSAAVAIDDRMSATRLTHPPGPEAVRRLLFGGNVIGSPSVVLLTAELLGRAGDFDERLPLMEDWDLWIRVASLGTPGLIPEPLAAYREHGQNTMSGAENARARELFELLRERHAAAAQVAGVEFGDAWLDRWAASRDLAAGHRFRAAAGYLRRAVRGRDRRDLARALIALGGDRLERLGRRAVSRRTHPPEWLARYA